MLDQLTEELVRNHEGNKEEKLGEGHKLSAASYRRYVATGISNHWGN